MAGNGRFLKWRAVEAAAWLAVLGNAAAGEPVYSAEAVKTAIGEQFEVKLVPGPHPANGKTFRISGSPMHRLTFHVYPSAAAAREAFRRETTFINVPRGALEPNGLWEDSAKFGNGWFILAGNLLLRLDADYPFPSYEWDQTARLYAGKVLAALREGAEAR